jgi:hypothetical protein
VPRRLALGQNKEGGTLFPKTKNHDGTSKPNGGWEEWNGNGDDAAAARRPAHRPQAPAQRQPPAGQPRRPATPTQDQNVPF